MSDRASYHPKWLRDEAEKYFRLADSLTAQKDHETVMEYGRELIKRAEFMEAAMHRAPIEA